MGRERHSADCMLCGSLFLHRKGKIDLRGFLLLVEYSLLAAKPCYIQSPMIAKPDGLLVGGTRRVAVSK